MTTTTDSLGCCPRCGESIPSAWTLIEYETGVFAECPACEAVVDPD
ncbi:hypothetical protein [Haloplanus halobius]|nr:hypothetical protein [Haloplanus sp. XH21]